MICVKQSARTVKCFNQLWLGELIQPAHLAAALTLMAQPETHHHTFTTTTLHLGSRPDLRVTSNHVYHGGMQELRMKVKASYLLGRDINKQLNKLRSKITRVNKFHLVSLCFLVLHMKQTENIYFNPKALLYIYYIL